MTIRICALIFKPIYLLQLTDDNISVALVSGWSIVIESVTKLGIPTDHMCWFHMDSCRAIVCNTTCIRLLCSGFDDVTVLSLVHECHPAWYPMAYERTCYDNTILVDSIE